MSELKNCLGCNIEHPIEDFSPGKNQCRAYKVQQQKDAKAKKILLGETRTCIGECGLTKPLNKFHGKICSTCYERTKVSRNKEIISNLGVDDKGRQDSLDKGRHPTVCCQEDCKKPFEPDYFKYDPTKRCFIGTCKECYNKMGYTAISRAKDKERDPNAYYKKYADASLHFRNNHPEVLEKYNSKRRIDVDTKMNVIIRSSYERNINFSQRDFEAMKDKLSIPCVYCSFTSDETLSGLDRIDNNFGYCDLNTVPCCSVCNSIKKNHSVAEFYSLVDRITKKHPLLNLPEIHTLPATFWGAGKTKEFSNKTLSLNLSEIETIRSCPCYLCGEEGPNGIDRCDSSLGYTRENSMPTCSTCNYAKKDYPISEFLVHLHFINKNGKRDIHFELNMAVYDECMILDDKVGSSSKAPSKRNHNARHKLIKVTDVNSGVFVAKYDSLNAFGGVIKNKDPSSIFTKQKGIYKNKWLVEVISPEEYDILPSGNSEFEKYL